MASEIASELSSCGRTPASILKTLLKMDSGVRQNDETSVVQLQCSLKLAPTLALPRMAREGMKCVAELRKDEVASTNVEYLPRNEAPTGTTQKPHACRNLFRFAIAPERNLPFGIHAGAAMRGALGVDAAG